MHGLGEELQDFDLRLHGGQVERMLNTEREELFASPQFRIMEMLISRTITPQVKDSYNSLTMQVLKSTYPTKNPVRSFVAYEKSGSNAFIRLLVTHDEVRKNGYGTQLIRQVIVSLAAQGITQLKLETRKTNVRAVAFYDKLLRNANDVSYLKKDVQVDNTNIIRYEVTLLPKGIT